MKKYKKSALRETLERNMRAQRDEPGLTVSPMEFARWLRCYCETVGLPERVMRAKELETSVVDAFSTWLGYPLR